jgi:hypothetical protein
MTTTTTIDTNANGRKRPNLGEQINRLDSMLDGLSEGLNEAVADAVKAAVGTAVKEAVQTVLTEILTNPEIRARLSPPAAPVATPVAPLAPARPSVWKRLIAWWQLARIFVGNMRETLPPVMRQLRAKTADVAQRAIVRFNAFKARCEVLRPFKSQILTAVGIGVMVGVAVWYAGPWIAAFASGVGGFVTTLAVQAGLWLRKSLAFSFEPLA